MLAGINLVICETACSPKKDSSLMLLVQSCMGEKIFKFVIFLPNIYPLCSAFDVQKKDDH